MSQGTAPQRSNAKLPINTRRRTQSTKILR